jgi:hypothetical protein
MLLFRTIALLSAALRASSYFLPRDVQSSAGLRLLETRQDEIEENDYNVTTRIGSFKGCSNSQASDIRQAWKDAMMIANAIGDPATIQPTSWLFFDFFGNYKKEVSDWEQKWKLVQGERPCARKLDVSDQADMVFGKAIWVACRNKPGKAGGVTGTTAGE